LRKTRRLAECYAKKKAISGWPSFLRFLGFFLRSRIIFFIIGEIELLGDEIETVGNHGADTTAIDKDKFPVGGGYQYIVDNGDDLDPFPVAGFEEEKNLFPF